MKSALSCTINLAFYFAREYYTIIRELPAGKGFADICLIPRKIYADKPAAVIELKWNKSVEGAIAQIKEKKYVDALKDYQGNLLLVAVNYDKNTKRHSCEIEKLELVKVKNDRRNQTMSDAVNCEYCVNYSYDDDYECYTCEVNLDEDEMVKFITGSFHQCPYFKMGDEYRIVRKQM